MKLLDNSERIITDNECKLMVKIIKRKVEKKLNGRIEMAGMTTQVFFERDNPSRKRWNYATGNFTWIYSFDQHLIEKNCRKS